MYMYSSIQTQIIRSDLKKRHDNPQLYKHDNPQLFRINKNCEVSELFQNAEQNVSLWKRFTTNKWDRAKKEARECLVKHIINIQKFCSKEWRESEVLLNKISDFFTLLDQELFNNIYIDLGNKNRDFAAILRRHGIPDYVIHHNINYIIEYGVLLSYHQNETLDKIRNKYFSCFNRDLHNCTKSIQKLKKEIKKRYTDQKLFIAVETLMHNDTQSPNITAENRDAYSQRCKLEEANFTKKYGMNRFKLARQALNEGAKITTRKEFERSPFHRVVTYNCVGILKEFILHRTCMDELSPKEFFVPFHWAIEFGYTEIVEELLKYNKKIGVKDSLDETEKNLLHKAACKNRTEIARLLINTEEIDLNAVDNRGWTALHWAVWEENPNLVSMLLDAGAELFILNKEGRTPLDLAQKREFEDPTVLNLISKAARLKIEIMMEPTLEVFDINYNLRNIVQDYLCPPNISLVPTVERIEEEKEDI